MTQACSRISGHSVRRNRADWWRGMVALSGLSLILMLGCGFTPTRALGIPGAASRTPDLLLPLPASDRSLALLYLDKKHPPRGQWEHWSKEEIDAELATVTAATRTRFRPLLDALAQAAPSARSMRQGLSVPSSSQPGRVMRRWMLGCVVRSSPETCG